MSTHKKSASLSILSGNYENIGQTYTFCFGFLFIFNTCTRYMDFILAKNMIPVFYHKLNFHLLLMWQYDVPTFWAIWNKTRASFDEVVYFCSLYCVSRMWINNGESVACRLFLVHVQTRAFTVVTAGWRIDMFLCQDMYYWSVIHVYFRNGSGFLPEKQRNPQNVNCATTSSIDTKNSG